MWLDPDDAISHARGLVDQGADIVDIGGESTRPGVARTPQAEELRRVVPIVSALADSGAVISVDTMRAEVARAAIGAGAQIINDVSGGLADRGILPVVADADVDYVVMHWRGPSATMQSVELTHYDNLVDDVVAELSERVADAERAGCRAQPDHRRPRNRILQERTAELAAAAGDRHRPGGLRRSAAAVGGLPQGVPRRPAARPGSPAAAGPRRRHPGTDLLVRRPPRLGGAHPRGSREPGRLRGLRPAADLRGGPRSGFPGRPGTCGQGT